MKDKLSDLAASVVLSAALSTFALLFLQIVFIGETGGGYCDKEPNVRSLLSLVFVVLWLSKIPTLVAFDRCRHSRDSGDLLTQASAIYRAASALEPCAALYASGQKENARSSMILFSGVFIALYACCYVRLRHHINKTATG